MRLSIIAALFAAPAFADETPMLDKPCMEVIGPAAYGGETYSNGVILGIGIGYAVAHGGKPEDAETIGKIMGGTCRHNSDYTFGDVLGVFDRPAKNSEGD